MHLIATLKAQLRIQIPSGSGTFLNALKIKYRLVFWWSAHVVEHPSKL